MKVAFLGWGSLYWNPGTLRISRNWNSDGPRLPIEFARISENGRPSLVIYAAFPDGQKIVDVEVLWAEAADTEPESARINLAYRENRHLAGHENEPDFPKRLELTAALVRVSDPASPNEYAERIKEWARPKGLDAVVWTALTSNWDSEHLPEEFRSLVPGSFSCANLKIFLKGLGEKAKDDALDEAKRSIYLNSLEQAEKYIRFAPSQIKTHCRVELEQDPAFRWTYLSSEHLTSFKPVGITSKDGLRELLNRKLYRWTSAQIQSGDSGHRPESDTSNLHGVHSKQGVQPKDKILAEFSVEVKKAYELLNFILTEGHPCHIPDKIIEDIEEARELLRTTRCPSKEDRVKLLKAYRDLVTIPRASITFDGMPPTPFWNLHSRWLWLALIFTVTPLIIFLLFLFFKAFTFQWTNWTSLLVNYWNLLEKHRYSPIIWVIVAMFIFCYLYVFTGLVTNSKLNQRLIPLRPGPQNVVAAEVSSC
jgi:hypothetical protein